MWLKGLSMTQNIYTIFILWTLLSVNVPVMLKFTTWIPNLYFKVLILMLNVLVIYSIDYIIYAVTFTLLYIIKVPFLCLLEFNQVPGLYFILFFHHDIYRLCNFNTLCLRCSSYTTIQSQKILYVTFENSMWNLNNFN